MPIVKYHAKVVIYTMFTFDICHV